MWIRDLQLLDRRPRTHVGIASDLDLFVVQVVDLYMRGLRRKVATRGTVKVVVELHSPDRLATTTVQEGERTVPITVVKWPFDFASLEQVDKTERKRIVLDTLHAALLFTAVASGWDRQPFEDARKVAIDAGLVLNGWLLPRRSWSPNRLAAIDFFYEMTDDALQVSAVHSDRDRTEVGRVPMLRTTPFATVKRLVTHVAWVGNGRINVRSQAFPGTTRMVVRLGPPMTAEFVE